MPISDSEVFSIDLTATDDISPALRAAGASAEALIGQFASMESAASGSMDALAAQADAAGARIKAAFAGISGPDAQGHGFDSLGTQADAAASQVEAAMSRIRTSITGIGADDQTGLFAGIDKQAAAAADAVEASMARIRESVMGIGGEANSTLFATFGDEADTAASQVESAMGRITEAVKSVKLDTSASDPFAGLIAQADTAKSSISDSMAAVELDMNTAVDSITGMVGELDGPMASLAGSLTRVGDQSDYAATQVDRLSGLSGDLSTLGASAGEIDALGAALDRVGTGGKAAADALGRIDTQGSFAGSIAGEAVAVNDLAIAQERLNKAGMDSHPVRNTVVDSTSGTSSGGSSHGSSGHSSFASGVKGAADAGEKVGLTSLGVAGIAIDEQIKIQKAVQQAANSAGLPQSDVGPMLQQVMKLYSTTPEGYKELATSFQRAAEMFQQAPGESAKAYMKQLTPMVTQSVMSGVSTGASSADVAGLLAQVLFDYHISPKKSQAAMDETHAIAAFGGQMDVQDVAQYLGSPVAAGAMLGFSEPQVGGIFDVLSKEFKSQKASTIEAGLFQKMSAQTPKATKALDELGMGQEWSQAGAEKYGPFKLISDLITKGEAYGQKHQGQPGQSFGDLLQLIVPSIKGGRAIEAFMQPGHLALAEQLTSKLGGSIMGHDINPLGDQSHARVTGMSERGYANYMKLSGSQLDVAYHKIMTDFMKIGTDLAPAAVRTAKSFDNVSGSVGAFAQAHPDATSKIVEGGIGIGAASMGLKMLMSIGKTAGELGGGIAGALGWSLPEGSALAGAGAVAAPVAAIAGLGVVGGIGLDALLQHLDQTNPTFRKTTRGWDTTLADTGHPLPTTFGQTGHDIGVTAENIGDIIGGHAAHPRTQAQQIQDRELQQNGGTAPPVTGSPGLIGTAGQDFSKLGTDAQTALAAIKADVSQTFANIGSGIHNSLSTVGADVGQTFANVGSGIHNTTSKIGSDVGQTFANLGSGIHNSLSTIGSDVGQTFANLGTGISSSLASIGSSVGTTFASLGGTIHSALSTVGSAVGAWMAPITSAFATTFSGLGGALSTTLSGLSGAFHSTLSGLASAVQTTLTPITSAFGTFFSGLGSKASSGLSALGSAFGSTFASLGSTVSSHLATLGSSMGTFFSGLGTKAQAGLTGMTSAFGSTFATLGSTVSSHLASLGSSMGAFFSGLGSKAQAGLTGITSSFGTTFASLGATVSSHLATIGSSFGSTFSKIGSVVSSSLAAIGSSIGSQFASFGSVIHGALGAIGSDVGSVFSHIGSSIGSALGSAGSTIGGWITATLAAFSSFGSTLDTASGAALGKWIGDFGKSLGTLAGTIGSWFGTELAAFGKAAGSWMGALGSGITSDASKISSALVSAVTSALSAAKSAVTSGAGSLGGAIGSAIGTAVHNALGLLGAGGGGSGLPGRSGDPVGGPVFGLPYASESAGPASMAGVPGGYHTDIQVPAGSPFYLPGGKSAQYQLDQRYTGQGYGDTEVWGTPNGGKFDFMHMQSMPNLQVGKDYRGGTFAGDTGGIPGVDPGVTSQYSTGAHLHVGYTPQAYQYIYGATGGKGFVPGPLNATYGGSSFGMPAGGNAGGGAYSSDIMAAAKRYGVPSALIASIIQQESGGHANAPDTPGADGADIGLMQFGPVEAADAHGQYTRNPAQNIMTGTGYLDYLYNGPAHHDWRVATEMYNAGPGNPGRGAGYANQVFSRMGQGGGPYLAGGQGGGVPAGAIDAQGVPLLPNASALTLALAAKTQSGQVPVPTFAAAQHDMATINAQTIPQLYSEITKLPKTMQSTFLPGLDGIAATWDKDQQGYLDGVAKENTRYAAQVQQIRSGATQAEDKILTSAGIRQTAASQTELAHANAQNQTYEAARTAAIAKENTDRRTAGQAEAAARDAYLARRSTLETELHGKGTAKHKAVIDRQIASLDAAHSRSVGSRNAAQDRREAADRAHVASLDAAHGRHLTETDRILGIHNTEQAKLLNQSIQSRKTTEADALKHAAKVHNDNIANLKQVLQGHVGSLDATLNKFESGLAKGSTPDKVWDAIVAAVKDNSAVLNKSMALTLLKGQPIVTTTALTPAQRNANRISELNGGGPVASATHTESVLQQMDAYGPKLAANAIQQAKLTDTLAVATAIGDTFTGNLSDYSTQLGTIAGNLTNQYIAGLTQGKSGNDALLSTIVQVTHAQAVAKDVTDGFNAKVALASGSFSGITAAATTLSGTAMTHWQDAMLKSGSAQNAYTGDLVKSAQMQQSYAAASNNQNIIVGELTGDYSKLSSGLQGVFTAATDKMSLFTASIGRTGDGLMQAQPSISGLASASIQAADNLPSMGAIVSGLSSVQSAARDAARTSYARTGSITPDEFSAYGQASKAVTNAAWDQVGADLQLDKSNNDLTNYQKDLSTEVGLQTTKVASLTVQYGANSTQVQQATATLTGLQNEATGLTNAINAQTSGTQLSASDQALATAALSQWTSATDPATQAAKDNFVAISADTTAVSDFGTNVGTADGDLGSLSGAALAAAGSLGGLAGAIASAIAAIGAAASGAATTLSGFAAKFSAMNSSAGGTPVSGPNNNPFKQFLGPGTNQAPPPASPISQPIYGGTSGYDSGGYGPTPVGYPTNNSPASVPQPVPQPTYGGLRGYDAGGYGGGGAVANPAYATSGPGMTTGPFGLQGVTGTISAQENEGFLVGTSGNVTDTDYRLANGSQQPIYFPGNASQQYQVLPSSAGGTLGSNDGIGGEEEANGPNGRFALLHLSQTVAPGNYTGGQYAGTTGWPTNPEYGNGIAGAANAQLCVVYDGNNNPVALIPQSSVGGGGAANNMVENALQQQRTSGVINTTAPALSSGTTGGTTTNAASYQSQWNAGYNAFIIGQAPAENPYIAGVPEADAWQQGWQAAKAAYPAPAALSGRGVAAPGGMGASSSIPGSSSTVAATLGATASTLIGGALTPPVNQFGTSVSNFGLITGLMAQTVGVMGQVVGGLSSSMTGVAPAIAAAIASTTGAGGVSTPPGQASPSSAGPSTPGSFIQGKNRYIPTPGGIGYQVDNTGGPYSTDLTGLPPNSYIDSLGQAWVPQPATIIGGKIAGSASFVLAGQIGDHAANGDNYYVAPQATNKPYGGEIVTLEQRPDGSTQAYTSVGGVGVPVDSAGRPIIPAATMAAAGMGPGATPTDYVAMLARNKANADAQFVQQGMAHNTAESMVKTGALTQAQADAVPFATQNPDGTWNQPPIPGLGSGVSMGNGWYATGPGQFQQPGNDVPAAMNTSGGDDAGPMFPPSLDNGLAPGTPITTIEQWTGERADMNVSGDILSPYLGGYITHGDGTSTYVPGQPIPAGGLYSASGYTPGSPASWLGSGDTQPATGPFGTWTGPGGGAGDRTDQYGMDPNTVGWLSPSGYGTAGATSTNPQLTQISNQLSTIAGNTGSTATNTQNTALSLADYVHLVVSSLEQMVNLEKTSGNRQVGAVKDYGSFQNQLGAISLGNLVGSGM